MEDLSGKTLGPYQIVAPLGDGGMAAVFKAYQPSVERYVALKVLPRQFAEDPQFVARFRREAKLVGNLQHPHILPVFDSGESDGYSYLVMPLISGGTLAAEMRNAPLPFARVRKVMEQLCGALDLAHQSGMVHRDIKPSNVLVDPGGNCLLSDFGLARMVEGSLFLTSAGTVMGTPAYMSPEQCLGKELDRRSDVYSLGILLYEMLTGRAPYLAETAPAVLYKHIHEPLPLLRAVLPDAPEALERLILKALAKDPQDRYQSAAALGAAVERALAGTPVPNQPPVLRAASPEAAAPTRVCGRPRVTRRVIVAGALGVGALGAVSWAAGQRGRSQTPASQATAAATRAPQPAPPAVIGTGQPRPDASSAASASMATPALFRILGDSFAEFTLVPGVTLQCVRVPSGSFLMGSADDDPLSSDYEKPQHRLSLGEYWICRTPVTVAQFTAFVRTAGYQSAAEKEGKSWVWSSSELKEVAGANWAHPLGPGSDIGRKAGHPVTHISLADGLAFCAWVSALARVELRLPTEAEWEKATRGADGRRYPWGSEAPDATRCNYASNEEDTTEVGKYGPRGASPYGCDDLAGNVWEWTGSLAGRSASRPDYPYPYSERLAERENALAGEDVLRIMRGGAFTSGARFVRSASRSWDYPTFHGDTLGFRIALSRLPAS